MRKALNLCDNNIIMNIIMTMLYIIVFVFVGTYSKSELTTEGALDGKRFETRVIC